MTPPAAPSKPVTERVQPEITHLPRLHAGRKLARWLLQGLVRLLVRLLTRPTIRGQEYAESQGNVLVVSNHLGDADLLLGLAFAQRMPDFLAKAELRDLPIIGVLMDIYGVIWLHRGRPDRRALQAALQGLRQGRVICIAPEGRESVTGALEEATNGAAYLAVKSGVQVVPVTVTGTENRNVYGNLKRLRRPAVSLTIGPPFRIETGQGWRQDVENGTRQIMQTLAAQLPPEYRGVYGTHGDET